MNDFLFWVGVIVAAFVAIRIVLPLVIIAVVGLCVLIFAGGTIAFAFLIACWDDFVSRKWM